MRFRAAADRGAVLAVSVGGDELEAAEQEHARDRAEDLAERARELERKGRRSEAGCAGSTAERWSGAMRTASMARSVCSSSRASSMPLTRAAAPEPCVYRPGISARLPRRSRPSRPSRGAVEDAAHC